MANRFGARIVPAVSIFPGEFETLEAAIDRYGVLCDAAGEHDIQVPIEFLPWSDIPDLATAWRIVDATDRPSGGIMIDTWHTGAAPILAPEVFSSELAAGGRSSMASAIAAACAQVLAPFA